MDGRRLRKLVREVHDESIATSGANRWSRKAAVIRPRIGADARRNRLRGDASLERNLDDLRVGIDIDGFDELESRIPTGRLQALRVGDTAVTEDQNEEKN